MKKTVAFIDDENGPIIYYEMALIDAGFVVTRLHTFSEALDFIRNASLRPDFWIVDVMMPIEDATLCVNGIPVIETTNMGLAAGLLLYKKIKETDDRAPVMLLTSIATPSLLNNIEESLLEDDTCEAKLDLLPSELALQVTKRLNS